MSWPASTALSPRPLIYPPPSPVVEATDWRRPCSLEASDWSRPPSWPSPIRSGLLRNQRHFYAPPEDSLAAGRTRQLPMGGNIRPRRRSHWFSSCLSLVRPLTRRPFPPVMAEVPPCPLGPEGTVPVWSA